MSHPERDAVEAIGDPMMPARRALVRGGLSLAAMSVAGLWLPACARMTAAGVARPSVRNRPIDELDASDALNGGTDPVPIPWLDRNGSHNQSPEPGAEPSNIFHFRGRVARANDFTGIGTDGAGRRIPFGAKSTDFSFMQGEYFAGRAEHQGTFGHI